MDAREARALGEKLTLLAMDGDWEAGYRLLQPVLSQRTPFHLLDLVGAGLGQAQLAALDPLLERIGAGGSMGGWPVIGAALGRRLGEDFTGVYARCRAFTIQGDSWYATDILGERAAGPGLVLDFDRALILLAPWRQDDNRWVRRSVGVAVHLWTKRVHGDPGSSTQAKLLLEFLEAMLLERNQDAIKGVGWGLKTLGHFYPNLQADWLKRQVAEYKRPTSGLMLRKALTYLPAEQRQRILECR